MELQSMLKQGGEQVEKITEAQTKANVRRQELDAIRELKRNLDTERQPLAAYAQSLVDLSPDRSERRGSIGDKLYVSPLIRVGTVDDGKDLFISVKKIYADTSRDIDGYPDGRSYKFNRWEFIATIGVRSGEGEFDTHESNKIVSYAGKTLQGEGIYGSTISTERLYDKPMLNDVDLTVAQRQAVEQSGQLKNINETITLLRQSLTDENLNPRDESIAIPESLL